jgi:predicted nucleic acid-binding Zn finger protein
MSENSEIKKLHLICRKAKKEGKLSGKNLNELHDVFGQRFIKALDVLKTNRVKKYIFKPGSKIVWVVIGRERDYLVIPEADFCTCDDFYFRVLDRKVHFCYHLIAQKIACCLGWYDSIEETVDLYDSLMNEWKKATA